MDDFLSMNKHTRHCVIVSFFPLFCVETVMGDFLVSVAAMVSAIVVSNVIIQKGPAACHGVKEKYRENKRKRKEKKLLKKLEKEARRNNQNQGAASSYPNNENNPAGGAPYVPGSRLCYSGTWGSNDECQGKQV